MYKTILPLIMLFAVLGFAIAADKKSEKGGGPLKVLLIAGGCCHDYPGQSEVLKAGIESKINAVVTVDFNPDTSTEATFPSYESADWAEGVRCGHSRRVFGEGDRRGLCESHSRCAPRGDSGGESPLRNAFVPLGRVPGAGETRGRQRGVVRDAGYPIVQARAEGSHRRISFHRQRAPDYERNDRSWTTIDEELYNNVQVFDSGHGLASGKQMQMPRKKKGQKADPKAKATEANAIVAWTNEYGPKKTKVFSTTLGHYTETVADDRYLDLVTRGILWTVGKLESDGDAGRGLREDKVARSRVVGALGAGVSAPLPGRRSKSERRCRPG